jgi:hypothetical protein
MLQPQNPDRKNKETSFSKQESLLCMDNPQRGILMLKVSVW